MIRNALMFIAAAGGLIALFWSAWLVFAVADAITRGTEVGAGAFLLVYVALPAAVILMTLARMLGFAPWHSYGTALAVASGLLLVTQATWMFGLATRIAREPLLIALTVTAVVALLAVMNFRGRGLAARASH